MPGHSSSELAAEKRKQQIDHVRNYFSQFARLNNVAHRVLVANRDDCNDKIGAKLGFIAITPDELPKRYKVAAAEALGLRRDTLTIVSIVESGPSAKAGLSVGDELVALDGAILPAEEPTAWLRRRLKKIGNRPVQVEVRRAGEQSRYTIRPVVGCSIPVFLETDPVANAYTDARKIVIYTGMMRVARNDAELAAVVGHELAHATMEHGKKSAQNELAGRAGGLIVDVGFALLGLNTGGGFSRAFGEAGDQAYAMDFEREADYVGTYYLTRAGYNPHAAEEFWRAMARENPAHIFYAGIHPTSPERFLQMQKTIAEIETKKHAGLPLVPERKKQPAVTTDAVAVSADR